MPKHGTTETPPEAEGSDVSKTDTTQEVILMKTLPTLGILAGVFLVALPPKVVVAMALWVVSRSHPD